MRYTPALAHPARSSLVAYCGTSHRRDDGHTVCRLNPDEGVHADLKQAVPRKAPARSKQQLKRAATSHMRSLSKRPQRIRAIFRHPQFRYAA